MTVIVQQSTDSNGNPQPMVYDSDTGKIIVDHDGYYINGGKRLVNVPTVSEYVNTPKTTTAGMIEAIDYMQSGMTLEIAGNLNLNGNQIQIESKSIIIKGNGTTITNGSLWFLNCGREFNQSIGQDYVGGGALYDLNFDTPAPSTQPAIRRTNCVGHNIYNVNIYNFAQYGFIDETNSSLATSGVVSHINNNVFGMQIGGGQDVGTENQFAFTLQTDGVNGGDFGVDNNNYYSILIEGNSNTSSNENSIAFLFTYTISSGIPQMIGNHFYNILAQQFYYGIDFIHGTGFIIDNAWFESNTNDIYMNAAVRGNVTSYAYAKIRFVEFFNGSSISPVYDPPVVTGNPVNEYNQLVLEYTPIKATSASISANPPVSGTVYQNTNPYDIRLKIPITYNPTTTEAATLATGISSTSTVTTSTKVSLPSGLTAADGQILTYDIVVPAGWYYELVATNATIGTVEVEAA